MIAALVLAGALLAAEPAAAPELPVSLETIAVGARRIQGARRPTARIEEEEGIALVGLAGGGTLAEPAPWHLWRLRGITFEVLRELPGTDRLAGLLAADVDGDGHTDLVLFAPGRAVLLRGGADDRYGGELESLIEDEALEVTAGDLQPPSGITLDAGRLCTGVVGALRCWSGTADSLPWRPSLEVPLPIGLARGREGLRLTGMPVQRLPGKETVFAAGFRVEGPERLRVFLVAPGAAEEGRTTECWLRLPSPERVLEHAFFRLDGKPALAVTTIPRGSLSLFGEKRMRVWLLAADRTRTGKLPVLAVNSNMNLWQDAHWFPRDLDGDGREDLVLGYWKGLKDSRVVLESWMQKADGSFARGTAGAAFDVEEGDRSTIQWGTDVDGDLLPDLLVLANGALELHPGVTGKALVSRTASKRVQVGATGNSGTEINIGDEGGGRETFPSRTPVEEPIQPADLDGDGIPEWLLLPSYGGSSLTVVTFPR
ncbi:MAG TPA: hypothetical protein VFV75_17630 [Candidatus Polarisedimenticolaceae bacterium]|nr:hypothetical protein [Candidatus Polarisedimenticolaceae bacterium]